jgi:hypothetical protein
MTIEAAAPITIDVRKTQIATKYKAEAVSSDRPTPVPQSSHMAAKMRDAFALSMFGGATFVGKSK